MCDPTALFLVRCLGNWAGGPAAKAAPAEGRLRNAAKRNETTVLHADGHLTWCEAPNSTSDAMENNFGTAPLSAGRPCSWCRAARGAACRSRTPARHTMQTATTLSRRSRETLPRLMPTLSAAGCDQARHLPLAPPYAADVAPAYFASTPPHQARPHHQIYVAYLPFDPRRN